MIEKLFLLINPQSIFIISIGAFTILARKYLIKHISSSIEHKYDKKLKNFGRLLGRMK